MSPSQFRLIRVAGIGICFTLIFLRSVLLLQQHTWVAHMSRAIWLVPMACFVAALWASTSQRQPAPHMRTVLLGVQTLAVLTISLTMGGQKATNYEGSLLLVVALQIALMMPLTVSVIWIVAQTSILAYLTVICDHADVPTAIISIIFKLFTYAIIVAIKYEADERSQIRELNAQMMATRELYAEHSRNGERLRISRDLHDVLGHRLTALSLNLEIAMHKTTAETGLPEIQQAQVVTKDLLAEVREVVSAMRPTAALDLHSALERVAQGFSPIRVHVDFALEEMSCDAARGEVLVRCVQELITNAVKHGRARQVWIGLELPDDQILRLTCRDDGATLTEHLPGATEGTGLLSMHQRFEHYGGMIKASISPVGGFTVHGSLPMM